MQVGRPLFSQVMDFVPGTSFDRLVENTAAIKTQHGFDVRRNSARRTHSQIVCPANSGC
jgi:hypothetical protein